MLASFAAGASEALNFLRRLAISVARSTIIVNPQQVLPSAIVTLETQAPRQAPEPR